MVRLSFVLFILAALVGTTASAETKLDRYTERPSILKVSEAETEDQDEAFYHAHVEAAALLMALHANEEIYVLARDAEYLYDTIRLLNPKATNVHLLNVSRQHLTKAKAERLRKYLAQEGVSPEAIEKLVAEGRSLVLIDTGFAGTIPYIVKKVVFQKPSPGLAAMHTHLLASEVGSIPSLRLFTTVLGISDEMSARQTILSEIEHVAHYTSKSIDYEEIDGRWVPVSPDLNELVGGNETNIQSRQQALDIMGAMKRYIKGAGAELYKTRFEVYQRVLKYVANDSHQHELIDELQTAHKKRGWSILPEAMADMLEFLGSRGKSEMARRLRQALLATNVFSSNEDIQKAMKRTSKVENEEESKKIQFFEANQDLADLVIDPDLSIPAALVSADYAPILEVLRRGYQEEEFLDVLSKSISKFVPTAEAASKADEFVSTLWTGGRVRDEHMVQYLKGRPDDIALYKAFLADLIQKSKFEALRALYQNNLPDTAAVVVALDGVFLGGAYPEQFALRFIRDTMLPGRLSKYRGAMIRNVRQLVQSSAGDTILLLIGRLRQAITAGEDVLEDGSLATILAYARALKPNDARQFILDAIDGDTIVPDRLATAEALHGGGKMDPDGDYLVGDIFVTPIGKLPMTVVKVERKTSALAVYLVRSGGGRLFRVTLFTEEDEGGLAVKREASTARALALLDKADFDVVDTLETGDRYVIREHVQGELAQDWLKRWAKAGMPTDDPHYVELIRVIRQMARAGLKPNDLRAKDLTWNNNRWVFTSATRLKGNIEHSDVLYHVLNRVEVWGAALDRCAKELLTAILDEVQ